MPFFRAVIRETKFFIKIDWMHELCRSLKGMPYNLYKPVLVTPLYE